MSKKERYKRYGYEDAYDTGKENDWSNRLSFDDCIEIMNNQFNEIVELKQQLAEKDKEIKKLKNKLKRTEKAMHKEVKEHLEYYNADQKQLRKQVCNDIREKILIRLELPKEEWVWYSDNYVGVGLIKEILDQIEKGEEV